MRHPKPLYVLRSQIVLLDTELVEGKVLHWQVTLPYGTVLYIPSEASVSREPGLGAVVADPYGLKEVG